MVTNVSAGPCSREETSNADFPLTSTPFTDKSSSPYKENKNTVYITLNLINYYTYKKTQF